MGFVPVPNTVQVEVVYELDSQVVENVLYFEMTSAPTLTEVNALLDEIRAAIVDQLLPLLHNSIQLVRLVGTLLTEIDSFGSILTVVPAVPGGNSTSTSLPNNATFAVQFATALRGRSFRGRNYVPGIPATARGTPNLLTSAFRDDILDAYQTICQAPASDGWTHVVVSRSSGGVDRAEGVTTPVTAYTAADLTLDSQRRRLPGRGQ